MNSFELKTLLAQQAAAGELYLEFLREASLAHPELQNLRHWTLCTEDAHSLYAQFGFVAEPRPDKHMVYRPNKPVHQ
jgi:hypothetical protein